MHEPHWLWHRAISPIVCNPWHWGGKSCEPELDSPIVLHKPIHWLKFSYFYPISSTSHLEPSSHHYPPGKIADNEVVIPWKCEKKCSNHLNVFCMVVVSWDRKRKSSIDWRSIRGPLKSSPESWRSIMRSLGFDKSSTVNSVSSMPKAFHWQLFFPVRVQFRERWKCTADDCPAVFPWFLTGQMRVDTPWGIIWKSR